MALPVVLGSSSKWRQSLVKEWGLDAALMSADIDEKAIRHEDPGTMALHIARAKAQELLPKVKEAYPGGAILITADQVIECKGSVREKPVDPDQCREFLRSYRDSPAVCLVGVVVRNTKSGRAEEAIARSTLRFNREKLTDEVIEMLIKEGSALECAGGFVIELLEPVGAVDKVDGERETVQGLPRTLTLELVEKARKQ